MAMRVRSIWERKTRWAKAAWLGLLPFSVVYRLVVQLRNFLYNHRWLKSETLDRPVISIGNLTVGGTGKTPTAVWLAQQLIDRGVSAVILSRGYKRRGSQTVILTPSAEPFDTARAQKEIAIAGDEPFLMANLYGLTVAVGKNRYRAARELLSRRAVDVFIMDDGFQHRRLRRDADVLLLGADASGGTLPGGPFREPWRAGRRANFFLLTAAPEAWNRLVKRVPAGTCYTGALQATALVGFQLKRWQEYPLNRLYRSRILAVSGIGNPAGFYRLIQEWEGEIADIVEFPDHHVYTSQDWQQINRRSRALDLIVTTEKDLVKLARFPFAKEQLLALRVAMIVENGPALVDALLDTIRIAKPAKSDDGDEKNSSEFSSESVYRRTV
jgi:tetraacyldisaccharide 4'-kinase